MLGSDSLSISPPTAVSKGVEHNHSSSHEIPPVNAKDTDRSAMTTDGTNGLIALILTNR